MTYFIGVDGGGTKTSFQLFDEKGQVLNTYCGGPCHYGQIGLDGLKDLVKSGVKKVLKGFEAEKEDVYIGLGLAGYGRERKVQKNIEEAVGKGLKGYHWIVKNDIEIAIKGALNQQDGIFVIAGTGSIALASVADRQERMGGWGYLIGDEGSGYWIGKQVLAAFSKQADGRAEKTALYQLVMDELGLDEDVELVSYMQAAKDQIRETTAKMAKICAKAASLKDLVALEIYDNAGQELALMINTLAKKHFLGKVLVSYGGGVFKSGDFFMASFIRYLDDNIILISPQGSPEYGAFLYAKTLLKD